MKIGEVVGAYPPSISLPLLGDQNRGREREKGEGGGRETIKFLSWL